MSNATPGGTWSSGNNFRAIVNSNGRVTGTGSGGVNIFYSVTNGCVTKTVIKLIQVRKRGHCNNNGHEDDRPATKEAEVITKAEVAPLKI